MSLIIVGDVHGKISKYKTICDKYENTLQLGDLSFNYYSLIEAGIDPVCNKFFAGNHDNYDQYEASPHSLGNFGTYEAGGQSIFYVRGAFSIDMKPRIHHEINTGEKTWWDREQLNYAEMEACKESYATAKPKIVVAHTCPQMLVPRLAKGGDVLTRFRLPADLEHNTELFLQSLLDIHAPSVWIFGHWHQRFHEIIGTTRFIGLPELGICQINSEDSLYIPKV